MPCQVVSHPHDLGMVEEILGMDAGHSLLVKAELDLPDHIGGIQADQLINQGLPLLSQEFMRSRPERRRPHPLDYEKRGKFDHQPRTKSAGIGGLDQLSQHGCPCGFDFAKRVFHGVERQIQSRTGRNFVEVLLLSSGLSRGGVGLAGGLVVAKHLAGCVREAAQAHLRHVVLRFRPLLLFRLFF